MTEPRTAAGRALAAYMLHCPAGHTIAEEVLAIESEASAAAPKPDWRSREQKKIDGDRQPFPAPQRQTAAMFELWNTQTRNAIGSYPSEEAAVRAALDLMTRGYSPAGLFLVRVEEDGNSRTVATGERRARLAAEEQGGFIVADDGETFKERF